MSGEVPKKISSIGFLAYSLFKYDFSSLYTPLSHDYKEKLIESIAQTFKSKYEGKDHEPIQSSTTTGHRHN